MESTPDELRFGQRTMEDGERTMQRRGKTGSGARPEGIPGGRRDVTR